MYITPQDSGDENRTAAEPFVMEHRQSRIRQQTEKGELYNINRLKSAQTLRLSMVTRKRNEITQLMNNDSNLHLVKSGLDSVNDLYTQYQQAYNNYYEKLISVTERDSAMEHYENREIVYGLPQSSQIMDIFH